MRKLNVRVLISMVAIAIALAIIIFASYPLDGGSWERRNERQEKNRKEIATELRRGRFAKLPLRYFVNNLKTSHIQQIFKIAQRKINMCNI